MKTVNLDRFISIIYILLQYCSIIQVAKLVGSDVCSATRISSDFPKIC